MPSSDTIAPGTLLAGKLRVIRLVGEGGMGAVYEVEHELTKHRRALKLLHAQYACIPQVVARFLREASAAGRIGNPHIIETFDAGHLASGEPYIVMEFLDGISVDRLLQKRGPLPFHEAAEILRQACDGIQAAHDAGIVHRDIKPENLFLLRGEKVFVKILDFGISKFDPAALGAVESFTIEGSALGTPYYMSPEQVRGDKSLDGRTDVYALGVVLYELLTNVKPFDGQTLMELSVRIHEGKYAPPSEIRRDLPHGIDEVIAKAMAVDREHRYRTVAELADAVHRLGVDQWASSGATIALPASLSAGGGPGTFGPSALPQNRPTSAATLPVARDRALATTPKQVDTEAGVDIGASKEHRSKLSPWLLVALVGLGMASSAFLLLGRSGSSVTPESAPAAPGTTAAAAPSAMVPPAQPGPAPAVAAPQAPSAPVPEPEGTASRPATKSAGPASRPQPTTQEPAPTVLPPAPKPTTRARSHGLAEENPF